MHLTTSLPAGGSAHAAVRARRAEVPGGGRLYVDSSCAESNAEAAIGTESEHYSDYKL